MSDSVDNLLREIAALVGCRIDSVSRVAVTLGSVEEDLEASVILSVASQDGARSLQLLTDGYEPRARWMAHSTDYVIEGEYSDREADRLSPLHDGELPFEINKLVAIWQSIGTSTTESLLALLIFEAHLPRMAIVFDNDDILVGPADVLWTYLGAILSHVTSIRTENVEPVSRGP